MNRHFINAIKKNSIHLSLFVALLFAVAAPASAQRVVRNGLDIVNAGSDAVDLELNVGDYATSALDNGFLQLTSPAANSFSRDAGKPQLPLFQRLVVMSSGCQAQVFVGGEEWESVALGGTARLCPAVGARSKEGGAQPVLPDSGVYASDTAYGLPLAALQDLGCMGRYRIARLTFSPFRYNAASNTIEVCRHLSATIVCSGKAASSHDGGASLARLASMGLNDCLTLGFNDSKDYVNGMAESEAIHIVAVAPRRFRKSLRPLFSWHRQQGYVVEEIYVDGATNSDIKALLQQRYDQSGDGLPSPMYVILVGDAADIPVWPARQHISGIALHTTDMPYVEYTGDSLPDALLGRISVSDTAELNRVVEKTLAYAKGQFADTAYLHRSLLVAGAEERDQAPTVTNGQVNYLKGQLLRIDPSHDTLCYYNPASDSAADEIYHHLQQSGALVSYTSHCLAGGWRHPNIMYPMVDSLPEDGKPFFSVNNCCRANEFVGDCFGEHLLRKANGGAIGVIGATNETLWDEDYYWSVGSGSEPTLTPDYQPEGCGAFDRLLHTHSEQRDAWAMTQGQMLAAGNWAVTRSGSPYWAFYWEIYCLLGDPTLMPYIGVPAETQLELDEIHAGDTVVTMHGTPFARVAATHADTLKGICTLDGNGNGTMACLTALEGDILFTATAQYRKPQQQLVALGLLAIDSPQQPSQPLSPTLWPNPSDGPVTIGGFDRQATVDIYDLKGRRMAHYIVAAGETVVWQPANLPNGSSLFIAVVDDGTNTTTHKIAITR